MSNALIGHTGFVGSHLAHQGAFTHRYNSKNIEAIAGRHFEFLAISAMPATMWIANREPEADRANLERLVRCLSMTTADRVVVLSTVAVYPQPVNVNEATPIDSASQTPYGRHRLMLEAFAASHFPQVLRVRLPGLFGAGLKKNAIHDLLHGHEVHKLHSQSVYQFYNLDRLTADIDASFAKGHSLVNFATPPVSLAEVGLEVFGLEFEGEPGTPPARYDVRTLYSSTGYMGDRATVMSDLKSFVARERRARAA